MDILVFFSRFENSRLNDIFEDTLNLTGKNVEAHPNLHPQDVGIGEFILKFSLPFPVLDIDIISYFKRDTKDDSISIYYSIDSVDWEEIYKSSDIIGQYVDSINLRNHIVLFEGELIYNYFLKFQFHPKDSAWACGIDSLDVKTTFLCSRFFLPQLKLGENSIEYTDANGEDSNRNVEITIEWQESWENKPPNKVTSPVFPLHQSDVDSLYFAFTWEPATDDDGDEIVDYEFMLSDDDRMLFPHSPNFNLYVSAFCENPIRPYFKVKETGWLNDGETYYWRVRAKDARGAWSAWSDTWSFTPHGVMRPINGKVEVVEQSIRLSWERNTVGKQPDYYKIYASDEMNGFSPDEQTFFTTVDSTELIIPFDEKTAPFSFYRISACDTLGQESLISDVIAIPYPYMYAAYDSLRQDSIFKMHLFSNEKFYPFYYYGYQFDIYAPTITLLHKPDWLNYDSSGFLYSTDPNMAKKLLYMDSSQRSVVLSLDDGWGEAVTQTIFLQTTAVNNKPALILSDSVMCENNHFLAYITSTDGDINFGDTNFYTVLQKPTWLDYEVQDDAVYLFGTPESKNKLTYHDSLFSILAVDKRNDSTMVNFILHIIPHAHILSALKDTAIEDQPYSYSLVIDGYGKDITTLFMNVPKWLHQDKPNHFSGTPNIQHLNDTVLHFLTLDLKECKTYVEHEIIISVKHVNHPPVITTTGLPDAQESSLYTAQITAYDVDSLIEKVSLTYAISPSTSWLWMDATTGQLIGAPIRENMSNSSFVVTVCDQHGACDSSEFRIFIDWLNHKPELIIVDAPVCEDSLYTGYITSIDGDVAVGDSHTYIPLLLPEWMNFNQVDDTVYLSGIPTEKDLNDTIIRVLVIDRKHETAINDFFIQIIPKNAVSSLSPIIPSTAGKLHCQIINLPPENLHYIKIESAVNTAFRYGVYAINGTLLFSSPTKNLMEGTHYLPIDMHKYPDGIYIFVGVENNMVQHAIKFIK